MEGESQAAPHSQQRRQFFTGSPRSSRRCFFTGSPRSSRHGSLVRLDREDQRVRLSDCTASPARHALRWARGGQHAGKIQGMRSGVRQTTQGAVRSEPQRLPTAGHEERGATNSAGNSAAWTATAADRHGRLQPSPLVRVVAWALLSHRLTEPGQSSPGPGAHFPVLFVVALASRVPALSVTRRVRGIELCGTRPAHCHGPIDCRSAPVRRAPPTGVGRQILPKPCCGWSIRTT
jgi:hypothetical protein